MKKTMKIVTSLAAMIIVICSLLLISQNKTSYALDENDSYLCYVLWPWNFDSNGNSSLFLPEPPEEEKEIKFSDVGLIFDISSLEPNTDYIYYQSDENGNSTDELYPISNYGLISFSVPKTAVVNKVTFAFKDTVPQNIKDKYEIIWVDAKGILEGSELTLNDSIPGDRMKGELGKKGDYLNNLSIKLKNTTPAVDSEVLYEIEIIKKVLNGNKVSGVMFELSKDSEVIKTWTSNADDNYIVSLNSGIYTLEEKNTLSNLVRITNKIVFEVKEDGSLEILEGVASENEGRVSVQNNRIVVENKEIKNESPKEKEEVDNKPETKSEEYKNNAKKNVVQTGLTSQIEFYILIVGIVIFIISIIVNINIYFKSKKHQTN